MCNFYSNKRAIITLFYVAIFFVLLCQIKWLLSGFIHLQIVVIAPGILRVYPYVSKYIRIFPQFKLAQTLRRFHQGHTFSCLTIDSNLLTNGSINLYLFISYQPFIFYVQPLLIRIDVLKRNKAKWFKRLSYEGVSSEN